MIKILFNIVSVLFFVVSTTICFSQVNDFLRIEPINSDIMPVSIETTFTYENSDADDYFHTTDFSLTNKSDAYIGIIRVIGYELNRRNEELSTRVWSQGVELHPFETKRLSINSGSISSEATKIVWVVHTICSERGTMSMDLSDLRKSIFPYQHGKQVNLPKAELSESKCLPD